jgi:hypothetical protein
MVVPLCPGFIKGAALCANNLAGGGKMPSAKQEVIELIRGLPDDNTLEDIQYYLYAHQKILRGLNDIEKGGFQSQEDVEKRMEKWLTELSGRTLPERTWRPPQRTFGATRLHAALQGLGRR